MKKYYLIWRGYKNTNIVGYCSLDALIEVLNKLRRNNILFGINSNYLYSYSLKE